MEPDFFERVYEVVRLIPPGRVTTYGAIARFLDSGRSARAVGYALNACHGIQPMVPAHRVVNRIGLLSGKHHFDPHQPMVALLAAENIQVTEDRICDFERLFWNPESLL
jgi:methylated-DNA-protein-cysteine methyltransferase-like protein